VSLRAASGSTGSLRTWQREGGQVFLRETPMRSWKGGSVLLVIFLVPFSAYAQATASSGGTTSSAGVNYTVMGGTSPSSARPQAQSKSPHVADSGGPPADEVNRKALEQRAGSDRGKMLLRSVPNGAQVFVDGAFVGHTPLLLIAPPGKYKIQMRGPREALGECTVGLAAKETQEIALTLAARYPDHVAAR
jgi:hypothetical protein